MATYMITVQNTGQCFPCREDEFVLAAMQRAGNALVSYGCHGGGCGVCKARVIDGGYFAAKPMSRAHVSCDEEAKNDVLLCCIQPRGDMRIVRDKEKASQQDVKKKKESRLWALKEHSGRVWYNCVYWILTRHCTFTKTRWA